MKPPRQWFGQARWMRRSRKQGAVMWIAFYPHTRFVGRFEGAELILEEGNQTNFDLMVADPAKWK